MKMYAYITDPAAFAAGHTSMHLVDHEVDIQEWVLAGKVDINIDVDAQQIKEMAVKQIDEDEKELRSSFQLRIDALDDKRQRILSITHDAEA
jgi:hypothetical protein